MTQPAALSDKEQSDEKPRHYRIFVVDDNESCAKVLMWTLEALGHTVQMATDGPAAIELAQSFRPDLVFLDIGLPGMNGYEICRAMSKEPAHQNTIFIAQTGWGEKEHRERSKEAGFDYHLVKPLDFGSLKQFLSELKKGVNQ